MARRSLMSCINEHLRYVGVIKVHHEGLVHWGFAIRKWRQYLIQTYCDEWAPFYMARKKENMLDYLKPLRASPDAPITCLECQER